MRLRSSWKNSVGVVAFAAVLSVAGGALRAQPLIISELMYHPNESVDPSYEFIEIYNPNPDPLDLTGYTICNGVQFTFARGTWLDGRSFLVVCRDRATIQAKYGITNAVGDWLGALANEGERIEICNPGGVTVAEVRYNDRGKWPSGADGTGHSLSLTSPFLEVDDPDHWILSDEIGGTPGKPNNALFLEGFSGARNGMDGSGFILEWLMLGPYTGATCGGGTTDAALRADWLRESAGGVVQTDLVWEDRQVVRTNYSLAQSTGLHPNAGTAYPTVRKFSAAGDRIDMNNAVWPPGPDNVMSYSFVYVDNVTGSPLAVDVALASDDAVSVLVNGAHVFTRNICRGGGAPGEIQDRAPATLRAGKNLIAVKVFENGGDWNFRLRVERRGTQQAITSASQIQITTDVNAGLGFDGSGEPILPTDEEPPPVVVEDNMPPVVINEGLFRTAGARWVELYNRTDQAINLGGYFLTDERTNLTKTMLASTTLGSGSFISFTEAELGLDFSVLAEGDRVFVALVEPGGERVVDAYLFEPQHDELSEARVPDGTREFSQAAVPTEGASNRIDASDDVVINEVMYHAIDDDPDREYIEFYNRGTETAVLTGWALTNGVDFAFPPGAEISPDGYLVVARNPQRIRAVYGLGAAEVIGPETQEALDAYGRLRDSGERITLKDDLGRTVDTVRYHDGGEFPRWADGQGSSMELIDPWQDNRFGQAWDASDDSSKAAEREYFYVGRHGGGESELHVLLLSRGITLVDDVRVLRGATPQSEETVLVDAGETWRYFKGTEEPPADWTEPGFADDAWDSGPTGIGYGDGDDVTVLSDMEEIDGVQPGYMTIFCRKTFHVEDPTALSNLLILSVTVDDGFWAYLNGEPVTDFNVTTRAFDSPAPTAVADGDLVERAISANLLRAGENVLAIQVHNAGRTSSDLTFIPRLLHRRTTYTGGSNQVANGSFDSSTSGWAIEGNHWRSGRATTDPLNGAGSLKIIASGRGDNKVNRIETTNAGMNVLPTAENLVIAFKARWVVGSQSILTHGYEHAMARSHFLAVPRDLGTPGRPNSVSERLVARTGEWNLGPVITDVRQSPAIPEGGEAVVVTARVSDADGVGTVRLRYSLANPSTSPLTITMSPVGEGTYRATIPGRPLGTTVVYYITATDGAGRPGRYPVDIRQVTHPLVVDPQFPDIDDYRYLVYRHDVRPPGGGYHSYRFYMTQAQEDFLSGRRRLSNDLVPGSFVFGPDTMYLESFTRFSGSPFARGGWGGSFRVALPRGDPLHGRFRKFNIDNHHFGGYYANERVSHYLLKNNQGGIRVPYSDVQTVIGWKVNDRVANTLEHVWVPDVQFLSLWYPDDDEGDFLEMDDRFVINDDGSKRGNTDGNVLYPPPSSRSDGNGANKENYRWFFGLRAKNGADDFSGFQEFCRLMDPGETDAPTFDELVWDTVNVEEFLRVWAVRFNTSDWDEWGAHRGKNCYFYHPEGDGRWVLLAWDMELTYDTNRLDQFLIGDTYGSYFDAGNFREVDRMLNRPAIKRVYYSILDEMVNGSNRWFHSSFLSTYMDKLAAIGMTNTGIGQPGGYVDQRYNRIVSRIRSAVFPQLRLRITTNGGADFVTALPSIDLAGQAPVDVNSFVVKNNDEPGEGYETTFPSMVSWTVSDIPLVPGANELTVFGFDLRGNVVDSDTITVFSTAGPLDPPSITAVDPPSALPGDNVEIQGSGLLPDIRVFFGTAESAQVVYDGANSRVVARVPAGEGTVAVTVRNIDGQTSNEVPFTFREPPPEFIRGDADRDAIVTVSDAVKVLVFLFGGVPIDCEDAADTDDDEAVSVTDATRILDFLFRFGPAPSAPFPTLGPDPSGDTLSCDE